MTLQQPPQVLDRLSFRLEGALERRRLLANLLQHFGHRAVRPRRAYLRTTSPTTGFTAPLKFPVEIRSRTVVMVICPMGVV